MNNDIGFSDDEIRSQVLDFMRELDMFPAKTKDEYLILDGQIHRYTIEGDKPTKKNGAYLIYSNGVPNGWIQDWKRGDKVKWIFNFPDNEEAKKKRAYFNSKEYKQKAEAERKKRDEELKEKQSDASERARILFEQLAVNPYKHPYLIKKDVFPYNLRIHTATKSLAVPLFNIDGKFLSIQWIDEEGGKTFFTDAPTQGAFWSIAFDTLKNDESDNILLGEGFATMAKVHELTQMPCAAAMNCGNLFEIAKQIKNKFPRSTILIMADDDKLTEQKRGFNPGVSAAQKVISAGLAKDFIIPPFKCPEDGTDWDDYALKYGNATAESHLKYYISYSLLSEEMKKNLARIEQINAQTLRTKEFPPVVWAVEGFLPSGLSVLAGGPKVGKSILSLHLSLSVAIGGCALGKINVQQGDVLYLALEDTQRRLQERIEGSNLPDDCNLSRLSLVTKIPRQHEGGLEFISWWLELHKEARLVIIDTFQKFRKILSAKGNMYTEDYDVVSEIKAVADKFNVPFLIVHHLKKAMAEDWINEISGSQGIAGAADTIFALKRLRTDNKGVLHRTGRDVEEKDFDMELDGFNWILLGEKENFTMPEWKKNIIDYLKEHPKVGPAQLSLDLNIPTNTAQTHLRRLVNEGRVIKVGYGTYELVNKD